MAKQEVWTCGACDYTWPKTVGALPPTAACPRCGAVVDALKVEVDRRDEEEKAKADVAAKPEG